MVGGRSLRYVLPAYVLSGDASHRRYSRKLVEGVLRDKW